MGKKSKLYQIKAKDEESTIYGSFHKSDIKRMANALMTDLAQDKIKNSERKAKNSLLKRLQKLIEDPLAVED